jgi:hypothetical protein
VRPDFGFRVIRRINCDDLKQASELAENGDDLPDVRFSEQAPLHFTFFLGEFAAQPTV